MNKTIFSIALTIIMALLNCQASGQNNDSFRMENFEDTICLHRIVLDSIYYESSLVYDIRNTRVSGLAVDAAMELFDYESYIRLILVDEDSDTEYLVFDAYYPKNMIDTVFNIGQYAHETTSLFNITRSHLKIEVNNAVCAIENIYYSDKYDTKTPEQYYADNLLNKSIQDSIILECINHRLRQENKIWVAGNTSLLQMTYDQRKAILPKNENYEIPNLQGFEYYIGGVFDLQPYDLNNRERSSYVDDFDWRDRHGQNWTTVAKDQSTCTSCWAFAPISAAENVINLYFNRHLDYDLSEQQLLSCCITGNCQTGGDIVNSINYLLNNGVVSENCFPYVNSKVPCYNICSNPDEHIAFSNAPSVSISTDNIKQTIINSGSICILIDNLWHYMAICGFKLLKIGDIVYLGTEATLPNTSITIGPNSPYIGQNCWLFKNSWGTTWGDDGFGYVITRSDKLFQAYKLVNPISDTLSNQDILCQDQDGDGYYNWGIGPKPATCPDCPDEPDCDDSDPLVGPFGEDYDCISFCDLPFDTTTIRINGSVTWSHNKYIHNNIEIDSAAILTVTSTINLNNHSKIIVHPGAKLVIDGGVLTSPCRDMWPGIQVWGNSSIHQDLINGAYGQGYLELKNGAVIENAICAVELWRPGDLTTTGGIVHASDATFHNNAMAVRAKPYTNYDQYTLEDDIYNGWFRNCSFTIDGYYSGSETFNQHVYMEQVRGIRFKGCTFFVNDNAQGIASSRCGIYADNAGFSVLDYCGSNGGEYNTVPCPSEYLTHSSFTGFQDGIHVVSSGLTPYSFSVKDALFSNNVRGVYANNTGLATILGNSFAVGCKGDCSYGVYLDHVTGFCIEENDFASDIDVSVNYGIGAFDCSGGNDIYLNTFDGLDCGNLAVGQNYARMGSFSSGIIVSGLTYSCNQNSDNAIDFCVLKNGGIGGVYPTQGSSVSPAGNTFDGSEYHFYNDGNQTVSYYYYSGNSIQVPNTSLLYGVSRISTNAQNQCRTHYGGVVRSPQEKAELERIYRTSKDWHERYLAAGDIVRSNLNEENPSLAELRSWLRNMGDIASDRVCVASYIQHDDFGGAIALATSFPDLYGLEGDDLDDHSDYMAILNLYKTLHDTHRSMDQMTDGEKALVEGIAEKGKGYSRSLAKAILERNGGESSSEIQCPTLPTNPGGTKGTYGVRKQREDGFALAIAPNPATTWASVDYTLPEGCSEATLMIVNTLGVEVMSVELEGKKGSKVISLEKLSQGVYSYTARCGSNAIDGKLIIMR